MKLPFELKGGLLLSVNTFLILILAFPVQVLVARYLGPTDLGIYAYILSFGALGRAFVALGLQDTLIPMYKRERRDSLFGSAILMRKAACLFLTGIAGIWLLNCHLQGEAAAFQKSQLLLVIVAATLLSDHEIFSIWWKCEGRLFSFVAVDLGGTLLGLMARLTIIANQGSMLLLLASYAFEQFAKLLIALGLYFRQHRPFLKPFRSSFSDAQKIGATSWPIWLSGVLTVAYTRVDQILLGSLLTDSSQLGQYSVAARLIEAMSAGAVALFIVYLPILSSKTGQELGRHLQRLHDIALTASLLIVAAMLFTLEPIVTAMYGYKYVEAAKLSLLYLAVLPVMYLGLCRTAFMYSQGYQRLELGIKIGTILTSLGLNLLLIPRYGALGAVTTSLAVQWLGYLLPNLLVSRLRVLNHHLLGAALLPKSWARLWAWVRN